MITINGVELSDRTVHYLETILWAETVILPCVEDDLVDGKMDVDEDHPLHGIEECEPLDDHFEYSDFTEEALRKAETEVSAWFKYLCFDTGTPSLYDLALEYTDDGHIAHDFWMTRNEHGVGYWDGDYGDALGDRLTKACDSHGRQHVWINEDGTLELEDG